MLIMLEYLIKLIEYLNKIKKYKFWYFYLFLR